jgi:hypothetical protein
VRGGFVGSRRSSLRPVDVEGEGDCFVGHVHLRTVGELAFQAPGDLLGTALLDRLALDGFA